MLTLNWLRSPFHPRDLDEGDDDEGPVALLCGRRDGTDSEMPTTRHHTEHFSTGFMGEPFGQWKTRENSSNWDTLPITLRWERTQNHRVSVRMHFQNKLPFLIIFSVIARNRT